MMKTIAAQQIKRRGISAVDELLRDGPVQVIKNNRPRYVVMSNETYQRMTASRSVWDWVEQPRTGPARRTRSQVEIDQAIEQQRDDWKGPA